MTTALSVTTSVAIATAPTVGPSAPMVAPSQFNLTTAQLCANLVNSAYDQFEQWQTQNFPTPSSFQWTPPKGLTYSTTLWGNVVVLGVSNLEPFGFVACDNSGNVYVCYRGTLTYADDYADAYTSQVSYSLVGSSPQFGLVHAGFYGIYTAEVGSGGLGSLGENTLAAINKLCPTSSIKNVFFTGHSMGAALCTLALPNMANNLGGTINFTMLNFASPRVGDPTFATSLNNSKIANSPLLFRVVNTEDIVPDAPLAVGPNLYEHIGMQVSFSAQYLHIAGNHSMLNCYTYAVNNPNNPQGTVTPIPNMVTNPLLLQKIVSIRTGRALETGVSPDTTRRRAS